jgi:hypothetical protein
VSFGDEPTPDMGRDDASLQGREPPPNRLRPLNLGDVLDGSFRLVREHWRAFMIGLGVLTVPLALLLGLIFARVASSPGFLEMSQDAAVTPGLGQQQAQEIFGGFFAAFWLVILAGILLIPMLYGTCVHIAAIAYRSGRADPMASVRAAGRRYLALLGAAVLLFLIWLFVYLLVVVAVAVVGGILISAGGQDSALVGVFGVVGLLAVLVIFALVMTRFILTFPALMIEGVGPFQALRRSSTLVRGRTGMVFLTVLIVSFIGAIVTGVLTWPLQWIGGLVAGAAGAAVGFGVGQIVSTILYMALMGAALVLIYFDRRVRTEGYDLTELADELGAPQDRSP